MAKNLVGRYVKVVWIDIAHADEATEKEALGLMPVEMTSIGKVIRTEPDLLRMACTMDVDQDGVLTYRDILALPMSIVRSVEILKGDGLWDFATKILPTTK